MKTPNPPTYFITFPKGALHLVEREIKQLNLSSIILSHQTDSHAQMSCSMEDLFKLYLNSRLLTKDFIEKDPKKEIRNFLQR